jgi:hypothetical protein
MQSPNSPVETTNGHVNGSTPTPGTDSPASGRLSVKAQVYEIGHRLQSLAKEEGPREAPAVALSKDDFGIPLRYRNIDLREVKPTHAEGITTEYSQRHARDGKCLLLTGAPGIGKTFSAIQSLEAWPKTSKRFFSFPALCGDLLGDTRVESLRRAKEVGFAVFDDLGMEYRKDGGLIESFIDEIVWHREANLKPTIFTTNLGWPEIQERYSPRIASRLGGAWVLRRLVGGASLR